MCKWTTYLRFRQLWKTGADDVFDVSKSLHQQKGSPTPVGATYGNQVPILHCPIGYCSLLQSTAVRLQFIDLYIELVLSLYLNILLILLTLEVKVCRQDWREHPSTKGRLQVSPQKQVAEMKINSALLSMYPVAYRGAPTSMSSTLSSPSSVGVHPSELVINDALPLTCQPPSVDLIESRSFAYGVAESNVSPTSSSAPMCPVDAHVMEDRDALVWRHAHCRELGCEVTACIVEHRY